MLMFAFLRFGLKSKLSESNMESPEFSSTLAFLPFNTVIEYMHQVGRKGHVTGIDLSEKVIDLTKEAAKRKGAKKVSFLIMNEVCLKFSGGCLRSFLFKPLFNCLELSYKVPCDQRNENHCSTEEYDRFDILYQYYPETQ